MVEKNSTGSNEIRVARTLTDMIRLVCYFHTRPILSYHLEYIASALIEDQSLKSPNLSPYICNLTDCCCGGMSVI